MSKPSLGQRWAAYQPSKTLFTWSCVASVIATIVVGFGWGGWTTGGSARTMAATAADQARSELVAAICVDRFRGAQDAAVQLSSLRDTQSWNRRNFIEKGGWVAMPGRTVSTSNGASLCAEQLLAVSAASGNVTAAQ